MMRSTSSPVPTGTVDFVTTTMGPATAAATSVAYTRSGAGPSSVAASSPKRARMSETRASRIPVLSTGP